MQSRVLLPFSLLLTAASCSDLGTPADRTAGPSFAKFEADEWSAPVLVGMPISVPGLTTTGPFLSHDELSLYFGVTNRPGQLYPGANIWVSHRTSVDAPWEDPAPVDLGAPASLPVLSVDGHFLFFNSPRPGCPNAPATCILVSHRTDTHDDFGWETPVPLDAGVNQAGFHAAPSFMQTAGSGQINFYFSANPDGGTASDANKIYSAGITTDGETVVPPAVVSELSDGPGVLTSAHPSLSVNGKEVYFYSSRPYPAGSPLTLQHIWYSTRQNFNAPWSPPQPASINAPGVDFHPSLSFDGRTLMWSSNRNPTGTGTITGRMIWMARRSPGQGN